MADKFSSRTFPVSFVTIMTERGGRGVLLSAGEPESFLQADVCGCKYQAQMPAV